ncbi:MAG: adenylate/guanylate cyclase domain-containing protein [Kiloniellales bacterium]
MGESSADRNKGGDRRGPGAGQRRHVTVLFADMAGYTALAEALGEEHTYLLMQRVHRALSEAVHAQDGTVQEITGDGIMALFGAPIAVEDAPLRACRAALDIQARMATLAADAEAEGGRRFAFRVGVHSGPLVVGEVGDERQSGITALGDTVNLAARIESEAGSGEVLISAACHALVEGFVDSAFAGEREIKGKAEKQKLFRLDAIKEGVTRFDIARSRGLTPLVGRARELERLEALWREAAAGTLRSACILGEPGIGKSRLAYELRGRIDDGRTFFLEGHCTAGSQGTPFAPLIELVRSSFRIAEEAPAVEAARKLERGLEMLGIAPERTLPYLMNLLGHAAGDSSLDNIADETLGIRTRDAILAMLRERCRISPTAMIVEDLHWADTATEGLLQRIAEDGAEMPLLLLTTARTGYRPPWSGAKGSLDLRLAPLSEGDTTELLKRSLSASALPVDLARMVAEKSEGNPLFAEEITSYLRDSGALRIQGGDVVFEGGPGATALPVTIENLLMDRFDRLEPGPRALLEAAAAIGPRFSNDYVAAAAGLDGATAGHLADLVRQELIQVEPGGGAHRFRHALARDAIYDSLLTPRRQELHERVAEAIEARRGDHGEDATDLLAHHWSRTARVDKAVKYLRAAGENSLRIYSLEEARRYFQQALDLIETNPGCADDSFLLDVLLNIARVMYFRCEFNAIVDLVDPYLPRVEALGDKKRLSRFLFESGYAHVFACKVVEGRKLLARARTLGEEIGDDLAIAYADLGLMWDRLFWGKPGEARDTAQREAAERLVEAGRRHGDVWLASKAQLALGLDLQGWGRPGAGRAELMKLMAMSRETNDPRPRSMALWALAALDTYVGNYAEAIENAEEALRICLSPVDRDAALGYKASAMVLSGRTEEGLILGERIIGQCEENGLTMTLAVPKMVMGVGRVMSGEMARGVTAIEDAAAEWDRLGQVAARPFGDLFLGETYLQIATSEAKPPLAVMLENLPFLLRTLPFAKAKARRCLERALDSCRALEAPSFVARCLYDLGLLDKAGKRTSAARAKFEEARALAAAVEATTLLAGIDAALAELPAA